MKKKMNYDNLKFKTSYNLDEIKEHFDNILETFENQEARIKYLIEENKLLKEEAYKDKELSNMKELYEEMKNDYSRGFPISKEEREAINKWQENHLVNKHNLKTIEQKASYGGAIGGNFKFEFIPTSIGVIGTCVCGSCRNRARRDSKGNGKLFKKILEEYDAEFIFQDI